MSYEESMKKLAAHCTLVILRKLNQNLLINVCRLHVFWNDKEKERKVALLGHSAPFLQCFLLIDQRLSCA